MITILAFLAVLMVLVMAHELGHLCAAKGLGIQVKTFSIGFGPKVARFRRGGTDYALGIVPLGGYVQLGEVGPGTDFRARSPHYGERPPRDKIIVALAGPLANVLLALVVLTILSFIGIESPAFMHQPAKLGWVSPRSVAAKAGLRPDDLIVEVDGSTIGSWEEMITAIPIYDKDYVRMEVVRDGRAMTVLLRGLSRMNAGVAPREAVEIGDVAPGSPAEKAGLHPGDVIRAVDGRPLAAWAQFQEEVSRGRTRLAFDIDRKGEAVRLSVTPAVDPKTGRGIVGIGFRPQTAAKRYGLAAGVRNGLHRTARIMDDSLGTFRALFTGGLSLTALGGPVAIARASGSTAKAGLSPLLAFLAFLSIQLAIFNLVPFFPVVDGGQISLFLIEMLRRRPLSAPSLERIARAGWAAMAVLIIFVTYNDVLKLF